MHSHRSAFTLIELSIVLVIVGLVVGGILGGQSLIQAQRVRTVLTDAKTYAMAMQQFKDKYDYFPGDFPTATNVWGRADGGAPVTANCSSVNTASNGVATCNGDGNGLIENNNAAGMGEGLRFWQHLSAAGFITGNFTGIASTGNIHASLAGVNVPAGSINNTAFSMYSWNACSAPISGTNYFFDGDYCHTLRFGAITVGDWPQSPALLPKEAADLDGKADDGLPAYGSVRAPQAQWQANCATTNVATTAVYNKSYTTPACILLFLNTFMAPKQ